MAFDQQTRNRLQRFVSDARAVLTEEFTRQLQNDFGLDPVSGQVTSLDSLGHLDPARLDTARVLRETLAHYVATSPSAGNREVLDRIVREQAFTVLNRLAALRMAEARGLLIESVGNGYNSKGFQLYARLAGTGLGETGDAYRQYLFSVFDEFSLDLKVLFDRFSPQGRLFPREAALLQLLHLVNDPEIAPLWAEDETIGWIYQYFNSREERKKMRDESAAPRNSRELAVRNQFFTPRYVVEFLTDNTLGRIWYEMTNGHTSLVEICRYLVRRPTEIFLEPDESAPPALPETELLSQEELLRQPVYLPHRPLKDPRDIRMLDPACGSMHFGLYAFDLFEKIYEEAWDVTSLETSLKTDFHSKEDYLREVPRLIIEHNIHGIDIDPRAVQIAGLSLWLRAQKSWQAQGLKPKDRPQVQRSNVVCAEPMPGETTLLQEFVENHFSDTPELRLIGQLVQRVFEAMKLAGEAGSLLKIEEEIASAVAEARKKWTARPNHTQVDLFEYKAPEVIQNKLEFDVSGITNEGFWEQAEGLIYDALRTYAESAEGEGFQRRLFAQDTARGFAFIDLCRKRYDVVLMNPPFGSFVPITKDYNSRNYPNSWRDMFSSFIERGTQIVDLQGFVGSITSSTFLNLSSFKDFRKYLLNEVSTKYIVNLGLGVMDAAAVSAACSIILNNKSNIHSSIWFVEAQKPEERSRVLSSICEGDYSSVYAVSMGGLSLLPQNIFAYWLSKRLQIVFSTLDQLEKSAHCQFGLHCRGNDDRLYRTWWEVKPTENYAKDWPVVKLGGDPQHFFRESHYVLNWRSNGAILQEIAENAQGGTLSGYEYYFHPGLTYIYAAQTTFSVQPLESNSVFSASAHGCFPRDERNYLAYLGLLNSEPVRLLLKVINPNRFFQSNYVRMLPVPSLEKYKDDLEKNAINAVVVCRTHSQGDECSRIFVVEWVSQQSDATISPFKLAQLVAKGTSEDLTSVKTKIDNISLNAYNLNQNDLLLLQSHIGSSTAKHLPGDQLLLSDTTCPFVEVHLSYLLGSTLGRWDIRFATGEKQPPELPDPFAPLPVCPPGMLQNAEGLPAEPHDVPEDYPVRISWPGILVDDAGHPEDIERRVQEILQVIWKDQADDIEHEAGDILGVKSLREYFRKPALFFADHLKRYSKSRRQAPIYWPLSTRSGNYTLWLYYHRLTDQTLYTCVNDFVEPKLRQTTESINLLRGKGQARTKAEDKELEQLLDLDLELQEFRDELLRLAQLPWKPNLNDGVQITAAPLWKLFRLPKWQKTLKETWEKLERGDYDWAHLAYTLWPNRVREKCKTDKSLAIAHDLEALYVEPPASAKKKRARKPIEESMEDE